MTRQLDGKIALVTGAARGIGAAIAARFVAEGAHVLAADIEAGMIDEAAFPVGNATIEKLDISDPSSVSTLKDRIAARHGHLDILVNNAGILDLTPTRDLSAERVAEVHSVNLIGTVRMALTMLPLLRAGRAGKILNLASVNGLRGVRDTLAYNTAKGAIVNLTQSLAADLGEDGINVNAIAPGFISTRMSYLADGKTLEQETDWFQYIYIDQGRIPLRRGGVPEDIAGPAVFLCSDASRYITGHVLPVDGGMLSTF
jgi:NAD(P)-dependent dehydrogenase (short-subunit alcohol dehydrogenase family)